MNNASNAGLKCRLFLSCRGKITMGQKYQEILEGNIKCWLHRKPPY